MAETTRVPVEQVTADQMDAVTGRRSHSQMNTYLGCPKEYELGRVMHLPRRPGAWFPGGTAVHRTIERYLRHTLTEREGK